MNRAWRNSIAALLCAGATVRCLTAGTAEQVASTRASASATSSAAAAGPMLLQASASNAASSQAASQTASPTPSPPVAASPAASTLLLADRAQRAVATAGKGLKLGLAPSSTRTAIEPPARITRAGVTLTAFAYPPIEGEDRTTPPQLRLRIAFDALPGAQFGLNYIAKGSATNCGEVEATLHEVASLSDGRWVVDAQLLCRFGEDAYQGTGDHSLLLVDPQRPHAEVLWKGVDTHRDAAGICIESDLNEFVIEADVLRIENTKVTTYDRQAGEALNWGDEQCTPKAKRVSTVARLSLKPTP